MNNVVPMITREQRDILDRAREWAELEAEIRKPGKVYVSTMLFEGQDLRYVQVFKEDLLAELGTDPHAQVAMCLRDEDGELFIN